MTIIQLLEKINEVKDQLVATAMQYELNLQHKTVIHVSQTLDELIVQFHSIDT